MSSFIAGDDKVAPARTAASLPDDTEKRRPPTSDGDDADADTDAVEVAEVVARPANAAPTALLHSKTKCIILVATVTGASFLNTLSIQAVVIILPRIGADIGIPDSRLQWVVSAYALTFGCFLLLWGRIADIYGKRLIFVFGTAWVAVVTAVNPFVPNEIGFEIFRGLQGLGAAANVPTALGILGTTFPPGKAKNYAFSTYAAGAPLGSIFGNLLAGVISQYASWKWVFGIMAIMGGVIAIGGLLFIPPPPPPPPGTAITTTKSTVDWLGGFLVTVGLLLLMFALTEGNVVGWRTWWIWLSVALSFAILTAFVFWQYHLENRTTRRPLMKISMFYNKRFSAAMVIMALFFSSFNNFLIYATYFFQSFQGYSALHTMFFFIPTGATGVLIAFAVAHLVARVPTYLLLLFGNLCVSLSNLLFAVPINPHTTYFAYGLPAMILSVLGADTTWPSLTLFTSKALAHEDQALGGALVNAVGQIGRAIGLAIATAVQTSVMAHRRGVAVEESGGILPWDQPSLDGMRAANWFSFALGICSFLVVAFVFRSSEIVGKITLGPARGGGEEGVMNEEETDEDRVR